MANTVVPTTWENIMASLIWKLTETLLGLLLICVVLINVVNSTSRHLLSVSIIGADELMVFIVIFVVMAGSIYALANRRHIAIDLLPSILSGRSLIILRIIQGVVILGATWFAALASWNFVGKISQIGTVSMGLGVPMVIPHSAVFLGFTGMALVATVLLYRDVRLLLKGDFSDTRTREL